jgi:hypothetical protein
MKTRFRRLEIITRMLLIICLKKRICSKLNLEICKIPSQPKYKLCKKDWNIRNVNLQNLKKIMQIFKILRTDKMIFKVRSLLKKEKNSMRDLMYWRWKFQKETDLFYLLRIKKKDFRIRFNTKINC